MVRKQIYIEQKHERQLRRIAERRGVSQAEVVRDAIEREAVGSGVDPSTDPAAWQEALGIIRRIHREGVPPAAPRRWRRDELYKQRVTRLGTRTD